MNRKHGVQLVTILIGLLVLAAFLVPIWHYLLQKDYFFVVESSCDPSTETCHFRDCSNEDDCPLGELEYFKRYRVHASDFERCSDNSCEQECRSGALACEEIACDDSADFECTLPEEFVPEEESDAEPEQEALDDSTVAE